VITARRSLVLLFLLPLLLIVRGKDDDMTMVGWLAIARYAVEGETEGALIVPFTSKSEFSSKSNNLLWSRYQFRVSLEDNLDNYDKTHDEPISLVIHTDY
jgi:hypothetical protein